MFNLGISLLLSSLFYLNIILCQTPDNLVSIILSEENLASSLNENTVNDDSPKCYCVHESQCQKDEPKLGFLDHLILKATYSCPHNSQICCPPEQILCTCVESGQCIDQFPIEIGNCNSNEICCTEFTGPRTPTPPPPSVTVPPTTPESLNKNMVNNDSPKCHCIHESQCQKDEPEPDFLDNTPQKSNISCLHNSQICCPFERILCTCVESGQCIDQFPIEIANCNLNEICCTESAGPSPPPPPPSVTQPSTPPGLGITCGSSQSILKKTISGTKTTDGQFPWFVAVLDENQIYSFAGSLIHPQMVLTAAHRVYGIKPSDITIKVGSGDLNSRAIQVRGISEIIIHEDYHTELFHNDLAILILDSPIDLFFGISTICLQVNFEKFDDQDCFSGGWGKAANDSTSVAGEQLQHVKLPLYAHSGCETVLQNSLLGPRFRLHDSFVCAGGDTEDTCEGDGGSPLFCTISGTLLYVQVGATAWGIGCGIQGQPGVYAAVNIAAVEWITREATTRFGNDAAEYFTNTA